MRVSVEDARKDNTRHTVQYSLNPYPNHGYFDQCSITGRHVVPSNGTGTTERIYLTGYDRLNSCVALIETNRRA
jgi:hypothetical protein